MINHGKAGAINQLAVVHISEADTVDTFTNYANYINILYGSNCKIML